MERCKSSVNAAWFIRVYRNVFSCADNAIGASILLYDAIVETSVLL